MKLGAGGTIANKRALLKEGTKIVGTHHRATPTRKVQWLATFRRKHVAADS
jgi:hypothetical protein